VQGDASEPFWQAQNLNLRRKRVRIRCTPLILPLSQTARPHTRHRSSASSTGGSAGHCVGRQLPSTDESTLVVRSSVDFSPFGLQRCCEPIFFTELPMSHIVTVKTQVRDAIAVAAACHRLGLPPPQHRSVKLFSDAAEGLAVELPGWNFPVVCDLTSGQLSYDNYGGAWGDQNRLDAFLQSYAAERAKIEARKKGYSVSANAWQLSPSTCRRTCQTSRRLKSWQVDAAGPAAASAGRSLGSTGNLPAKYPSAVRPSRSNGSARLRASCL